MRRPNQTRRLVYKALEAHGPLSDAQLAWWLRQFGVGAQAARAARYGLLVRGLVRSARRFTRGCSGRWGQQWEISPGSRVQGLGFGNQEQTNPSGSSH